MTHTINLHNKRVPVTTAKNVSFAFRNRAAAFPGLVHVDAIPGEENVLPHPLILLQAYREVINYRPALYRQRYDKLLDQLAKTKPESVLVLSALAKRAVNAGNHDGQAAATRYLHKAIELGSTSPDDFLGLSELLARSGQASEAVNVLRRGVELSLTPVRYTSRWPCAPEFRASHPGTRDYKDRPPSIPARSTAANVVEGSPGG
jgi:hypothetical protein